jgi:hypothetical protein
MHNPTVLTRKASKLRSLGTPFSFCASAVPMIIWLLATISSSHQISRVCAGTATAPGSVDLALTPSSTVRLPAAAQAIAVDPWPPVSPLRLRSATTTSSSESSGSRPLSTALDFHSGQRRRHQPARPVVVDTSGRQAVKESWSGTNASVKWHVSI